MWGIYIKFNNILCPKTKPTLQPTNVPSFWAKNTIDCKKVIPYPKIWFCNDVYGWYSSVWIVIGVEYLQG